MTMTVERVIVTVRLPSRKKQLDLELPAFLPMSTLCTKLLETLKSMEPQTYIGTHAIELLFHGRTLQEDSTLASQGAWDGSILEIRELR